MKLEQLRNLSDKELNERFPFMVCYDYNGDIVKDDSTGEMLNHFERNWGWFDIQLILAEHIKPIYDKFDDEKKNSFGVFGVKEKYGKLRTDFTAYDENIETWNELAEYVSSFTCVECGKTYKELDGHYWYYESKGWICPYCKDCAKKSYYKINSSSETKDGDWKDSYKYVGVEPVLHIERSGPNIPKMKIDYDVESFFELPED